MALEFPDSPTAGQLYDSGGRRWRYDGAQWLAEDFTALPKNMIVNGAMLISQQNGNVAGPYGATGSGYYTMDQWTGSWVITGGNLTSHSYSPGVGEGGGGPFPGGACVIYNTGAAPGGGATDHTHIYQWVEGYRTVDLAWGTPFARPAVLRFMFMATYAGWYAATIQNGAQNKSYCGAFYVPTADIWHEFVIAVPAITTGVWSLNETIGLLLSFGGAWGGGYQGTPYVWQDGSKYGFPGVSNWVAQGAGYIRVAKVGLYPDPNGNGIAPYWVHPQYAEEETECMRYFWKFTGGLCGVWTSAAGASRMAVQLPTAMRLGPALAWAGGTIPMYSGAAGGEVTGFGTNFSTYDYWECELTTTAGFTPGHVARSYMGAGYWTASARF